MKNSDLRISSFMMQNNKISKIIQGILASEGRQIFLQYFRSYLAVAVEKENIHLAKVPDVFLKNHIAGSFIGMVCWWADCDFSESPENLTRWFFCVMPTQITNTI